MISTDAILKMVSERHHLHKENGSCIIDDSLAAFYAMPYQYGDISILSELFPRLYSDHPEVKNKLGLTRKEQLLHAASIIVSELERIERDREAALCFLKYLP